LSAAKTRSEDQLFYDLKGAVSLLFKQLRNVEPVFANIGESGTADGIGNYPWIHPVKSVEILYDGQSLGYLSTLHPQIRQKLDKKLSSAFVEINLAKLYSIDQKQIKYKEPSKYPEVVLDYSFLIDKAVRYDAVVDDIKNFTSDLLRSFNYVDIYTGKGLPEGKESVTFRFTIGSDERTLSSEDINDFSGSLLKYMEDKGYPLR
jgi:phenylalanyl-tRNA synthetase beta chain